MESDGVHTTFRIAGLIMLFAFALAACNAPQTPVAEPTSTSPKSVVAQRETALRTSPFATAPADAAARAAGAANYVELLQRYPAAEQAKIKAWFSSYAPDSMAFTSNAQWQWMQQHDYPTPDDVLRASMMTEAQLRDLAVHGDTKATFFYLARLLDDYAQADEASAATNLGKTRLQTEMSACMDQALASGSAFAGYMYGGYYAALQGKNVAGIGRTVGLVWAEGRGDSRPGLGNELLMGAPGVPGVEAAEVYFDMFAAAARRNPYFWNKYRGHGNALIPSQ